MEIGLITSKKKKKKKQKAGIQRYENVVKKDLRERGTS